MKIKPIEGINFEKTDWCLIQKGYDAYFWIMNNQNNIQEEFKNRFAHFYKINQGIRNPNYKKRFFVLLKSCIENNIDDYSIVLNKLSIITGRNEMSFASKIVATVNPEMPLIDKIILRHLELTRPSYGGTKYKISKSINIHKDIEKQYSDFFKTVKCKNLLGTFDKKIKQQPNFKITKIKKLDFILWQTRN